MDDVRLNIFFAYARRDSDLRERLDRHLSSLKRKSYVNTWYDGKIEAGTEWEKEIEDSLSTADIILLLISADFIASDYCYDIEMRNAISRHEKREAVVIPVILRPCDWSDLPFSKIQGLPQNGKPVSSSFWISEDHALSEVAKSIKSIVEDLIEEKKHSFKSISEYLLEKENELRISLEQLDEIHYEQDFAKEVNQELRSQKKTLESELDHLKKAIEDQKKSFDENQKHFQKLISKDTVTLSRAQSKQVKLKKEIKKLVVEIEKLTQKKENILQEVAKIKRSL